MLKHDRVAFALVDISHSPAFNLPVLELGVRFASDRRFFLQFRRASMVALMSMVSPGMITSGVYADRTSLSE